MAVNEEPKAKKAEKSNGEPQSTHVSVSAKRPPWPLITLGIFASVVTLALIVTTGLLLSLSHRNATVTDRNGASPFMQQDSSERGFQREFGGSRRGSGMQMGAARGVVTAVSGDTITVSGNGKQVTVKKTDNTIIGGDKSDNLAVNDSVIVMGTTASDGTVTATRIIVQNNDFSDASETNNVPNV